MDGTDNDPTTTTTEQEQEQTPADVPAAEEQPVKTEEEPVKTEEPVEESDEEIEYECPEEFNNRDEMCKMFVGGLDKETTDDQFKELFATFGEIKEHVIIKKDNSKSDRLFGFVTFTKCDSLDDCLLARPHKYKDKELDVKRAVPKGQDEGTGHFKVKKLHVANVPPDMDSKVLKKYLLSRHPKQYGVIEDINFLQNKEEDQSKGKNRGFGFITVSTEDCADRISIAESKFQLEGASMRISKAKPRNTDGGRGFQHKRQNYSNAGYGGWDQWNYGGGYGDYNYGGYPPYGGYGGGYGYGGYGQYQPQRGGRGGGNRHHPYNN